MNVYHSKNKGQTGGLAFERDVGSDRNSETALSRFAREVGRRAASNA